MKDLTALYVLDSIKWFGPQKFKELRELKIRPADTIAHPGLLPSLGRRSQEFRASLKDLSEETISTYRARAVRQILAAHKYQAQILTYDHQDYPPNVYASNNPIPILYVRGSTSPLRELKAIACVGSRSIRPPYATLHREFAGVACADEFTIVSGFALGADTIGHQTAIDTNGRTICVMPCGLDRPFPPENKDLWRKLLEYDGAAFVSEFSFGTRAASLTLRKRNKLTVAFALGVLLSQSSIKGGAMNAYRFALEQRKPIATFAHNGTVDTSGNLQIIQAHAEGKTPAKSIIFEKFSNPQAYRAWLRQLCSST